MLQGVHERKISIPVVANLTGNNIVVPGQTDRWLYIHEFIGSLDRPATIHLFAGARELANFDLAAGQGLTLDDEPGEDNRPRFECYPGEDFIIQLPAGVVFTGSCHYSWGR